MLNSRYFLISGFFSFFIYLSFIFMILLYLNKAHYKKFNSISKDTIIELDIIVDKRDDLKKTKASKTVSQKKEKNAVFKKLKSSSAKKRTNLKSLFAKVSVRGVRVRKRKVLNVRGNEIISRFKSKFTRKKVVKQVNISKLVDVKKVLNSTKKVQINSKGNFDKYFSKIHSILLNKWYQYPLLSPQKYKVKVKITISSEGFFRYSVISLSGIEEVDRAVKKFLENEINSRYPKPPDGREKELIINFIPEI